MTSYLVSLLRLRLNGAAACFLALWALDTRPVGAVDGAKLDETLLEP